MKLSASKFAEASGLSVVTIGRYCKNGRVTAEKSPDGKGWLIDASELDRLNLKPSKKGEMLGSETPNPDSLLRREIELLREMLEREQLTVADLRARLDREAEERRTAWTRLNAPRPDETANQNPAPSPEPETTPPGPPEARTGGLRGWLARVIAGKD